VRESFPGRAPDLPLLAYLQLPAPQRAAAVRNAFDAPGAVAYDCLVRLVRG